MRTTLGGIRSFLVSLDSDFDLQERRMTNADRNKMFFMMNYDLERYLVTKNKETILGECVPEELKNPGAIDFIRRCNNTDEAVEILEYLSLFLKYIFIKNLL